MSDPTVQILHEDENIVVAVKPAGVEAQVSRGGASMLQLLAEYTRGEVYPVHRLDRETCGVMVYARTADAANDISEQFRQGSVSKFYLTVLLGAPENDEGEYRDLLYHDTRRNKSYVVSCARRGVREARLDYRVCERRGLLTLAAVRLHTGRTHQVRVQFASRGTPVYGDRRYGGKPDRDRWGVDAVPQRGIALACASLEFRDPAAGERMKFEYVPSGGIWDSFDTRAAVDALDTFL